MHTFVVFLPNRLPGDVATFDRVVKAASVLKRLPMGLIRANRGASIAAFPRMNGSRCAFAEDTEGNWLLLAGTCIPSDSRLRDPAALLEHAMADPDGLAHKLDGFFALVAGFTRPEPKVLVVTDPNGSFHVYSRRLDSGVLLSSSSLVLAAAQPTTIDALAAQEFVVTGVIYEHRSLYAGVQKLSPASIYEFTPEACRARAYWRPFISNFRRERMNDAADRLWETITAAAKALAPVASAPSCDLTGGYDSRILAAACKQAGMNFTAVVSGAPDHPDVVISRQLARILGVPHLHFPPEASDGPSFDQAVRLTDGEFDAIQYIFTFKIHRELARQFDISLNGSYGETARGYWWELLGWDPKRVQPLNVGRIAAARYGRSPVSTDLFSPGHRIDFQSHIAEVLRRELVDLPVGSLAAQLDFLYLRLRMQRWQGRIASTTDQIMPCLSPLGLQIGRAHV